MKKFTMWVSNVACPDAWKEWAGFAALSAIAERRVWTLTDVGPIYPSLFLFLVAGPAIGKTQIIDPVDRVLRAAQKTHIGPESVTKQGLIDVMAEGMRQEQLEKGKPPVIYHSTYISGGEFNLLVPAHEQSFLSQCCRFWDASEKPYTERTRGGKTTLSIDRGVMTIFSGIQPAIVQATFPETAWSQGFLTRPIYLYAHTLEKRSLFSRRQPSELEFISLVNELRTIHRRTGPVPLSPHAKELVDEWYMNDCKPAPSHPKFVGYNGRRLENTLKLSLLLALSRHHSEVTEEDFCAARQRLLLTEESYGDMVHEILATGQAQENVYYAVYAAVQSYYMRTQKGLAVSAIRRVIMGHVASPQHVDSYLNNLKSSGILQPYLGSGPEAYIPGVYREIH